MSRSLKAFLAASLAASLLASLAGCGGGSADSASASTGSSSTATLLPTGYTSEGRIYNTCVLSPGCSGNPYAPFSASVSMAPADGATLSGMVRIEVHGYAMQNVELLPATGYTPRLGVFNITGDKTIAWLDLDTTKLPNGPLSVRVSAFNVPAGQPGAVEIVAMPARTWNISNATPPAATFSATVTSAPPNGATVSGITHLELHGSGIANAELLPANGYSPRLGMFNVSADRTMAWLDFDTRSLPDGVTAVRISAFNVAEGQPGATEIIAMPARNWNFANGNASANPFTATVTIAPVNGETVNGRVRLEVRGSGLKNVELLPASGYTPQLGTFYVDFGGTFAWMELDTSTLPNGILNARISAFDVAAGQPNAREIIAMPARQWNIQH
jgi:hypothetical protein